MSKSYNCDEVVRAIETAYGSLTQPNYTFMKKRCNSLRRHGFVADLMGRYFIKDDTDMNDHAAIHLRVQDSKGVMIEVCLSFVANFAMLFRYETGSLIYNQVLDKESTNLNAIELEVLALLEKHNFTVLTKSEAAAPIEMNLFNTERTDTRIFHAIIGDSGVVPEVLL